MDFRMTVAAPISTVSERQIRYSELPLYVG